MAKKKHAPKGRKTPAKKKSSPKNAWIIAAVAVTAILVLVALSDKGSQSQSAAAPSPLEQEYAGRLLPAGYEEPKVAGLSLYSTAVQMSVIDATQDESGISIPLDSVISQKIVRFDYQRSDGARLPMLIYVKPSGGLFVGVNYCPPCEGEEQRIENDGTLTCGSCGTKRDLETNMGISGACKLYPLDEVPSTVADDRIVVDGAVLDTWTAQPLDRPIG